jgi:ABC-type uncharacterized transport system permease subunit
MGREHDAPGAAGSRWRWWCSPPGGRWRVLAGAYLFGAVSIGQLHAQAFGIPVPSQFLSALPYLATVVVLVLISRNRRLTMMNTPASLGNPSCPDR